MRHVNDIYKLLVYSSNIIGQNKQLIKWHPNDENWRKNKVASTGT